jgi:hypothetical protein
MLDRGAEIGDDASDIPFKLITSLIVMEIPRALKRCNNQSKAEDEMFIKGVESGGRGEVQGLLMERWASSGE